MNATGSIFLPNLQSGANRRQMPIQCVGVRGRRHIPSMVTTNGRPINVEEVLRIAEEKARGEVFGWLKRPEEKWIIERVYTSASPSSTACAGLLRCNV